MAGTQEDYREKIEKQMDKELEEIESQLADHPEITSLEADDRIKERIDEKIAAADYEKLISQLPEEYQEDLRRGRKAREEQETRAKRRIYAYWKKLAAAAAVVVLVAGLGITSVGGPKRLIEFFQSTVGEREIEKTTSTNGEEMVEVEKNEEEDAYQRIKDELGIDPVRLIKLEGNMEFKSVEIDSHMQMAYLIYEYEGRNISYIIQCLFSDGTWAVDVEDELLDEYPYELNKATAIIKEYRRPETEFKKYVAKFKYQDVEYQMIATLEWDEFEILLKKLHFL